MVIPVNESTEPVLSCLKSTMETTEQCVKSAQS